MTDILPSTSSTGANSTGNASTNASNLAAGQANLSSSYSTFLTLLTTQLQNQDPTSPMDTNAFTQQLVAMTGVQQQLLTNELLQQMVTNGSGSVANSVNLIGQNVTASTSNATLSGGSASWNYTLPATAAQATATISNSSGTAVWSGALSNLAAGTDSFSWNGQTLTGTQLPDGGTYSLSIAAADATGAAITPTISISGLVKSIQTVGGVTQATVGATQVPVSAISGVNGTSSSTSGGVVGAVGSAAKSVVSAIGGLIGQ
jgi:flagellar basal-body rod modification protein FlgD